MDRKHKWVHHPAMLLSRRLLLGAVGTLPLMRVARGQVAHRLTILHMNDIHSRHDMVDARAMTCSTGPSCFGSTPRLAAAIREQRAAAQADGRTVILLDAGDEFQGSLFYTAHQGMAELAVQHAVGVDAMTLGNHEFDNGPENLGRYIAEARFPVLSANIDATDEPHLAGRIRPFTILERNGLKIGVVGLTTLETQTSSSPGPNLRFAGPRQSLVQAAAAARAQGAQVIVALSHLGLAIDRTLAAPGLAAPGLAAIVGGHSHTLLSNTEPGAAGPYPTPGTDAVPIVQAGAYARYLGRLDLDLAPDGAVLAVAGGCRRIGADLVPDPLVASIVAAFAAPLDELRRRPVATLPEPLDLAACRIGPCRLGWLVADAMRDATHGHAIGLMNAGGLRVGLPAGAVTLGQVLDTMPFGNTLATLTLSGADLASVVKHGLSLMGRGGFAQWAGLRSDPLGLSIEVERPSGTWSPLDPDARYLVATNNFLRTGGDGYTTLRDRAEDPYDAGAGLADLLAETLARQPR